MFLLKTELNNSKSLISEFKKIYGLNVFLIQKLCSDLGLNPLGSLKDFKLKHFGLINNWIIKNNLIINDDLKKLYYDNKKILIKIKCYKGFCHEEGLPVRGQRTRTNARTQKRLSSFFSKKKNITKKVHKKK